MKISQPQFVNELAKGCRFLIRKGLARSRGGHVRALLAGAMLAAAMFPAVNVPAQPLNNEAFKIVFKADGHLIDLSGALREVLGSRADNIVRSCGYDGGDRDVRVWRDALAEPSYIHLVYAKPITLRLPRREILVSQAVFSLKDTAFLGQPILHHNGRTTWVAKCDGMEILRLMCMPDLTAYFPPGYRANCDVVRQSGREKL